MAVSRYRARYCKTPAVSAARTRRRRSDDRGAGHQRRHAGRHAACGRRLSPGCAGQISRAVRVSAAQQGHSGSRHRGHIAAATGARAALVRSHRGGRHTTLHRQRLRSCDCAAEGLRQVGRALRPRGYGPLRSDRMDHAATVVKRQGRNGRHLRICRRTMARCRAGTSGAESHLSVRRVQRVWRHVRIPRLQSRRRPAHLPLFARRLQHGS